MTFKKRIASSIVIIELISIELFIPYVKRIIVTSIYRPPGSPVGVAESF